MIHVLVGVQGSGKSTYSKVLAKKLKCEIVSSDAIRKQNPGIEEKNVWSAVYQRCSECIKENVDCIFDATSITKKVRKRFFDEVKKFGVNVEAGAYVLDTDLEVCIDRVIKRNMDQKELFLPPEVILSYYERLELPTLEEGFKFINTVKNNKIVSILK